MDHGKDVFLALMMDEVAIKKNLTYDQTKEKFTGLVDMGVLQEDNTEAPYATDALVLMVVSVNDHWKLPLGYFFVAGLNGEARACIVKIDLQLVHVTGARTVSLTCDGPQSNLSMLRILGANVSPTEACTPNFCHPSNESWNVHVFLDIVHMLKLARNTLGHLKVLRSPSGEVRWDFIEKLNSLQEREGLRAGTKLTKRHIKWEQMKMKVSLAAQTLSNSAADAIDHCRDDLRLPDFAGSKATTEFIRLFDHLFDIFNTRSLMGVRYKAALTPSNEFNWISILTESIGYIRALATIDGVPLVQTRLKTGFVGFLSGVQAIQSLYDDLVRYGPLPHLLTYKLSQDHLELFFCDVRSRLRANNNPSCYQFESLFKRFLVRQEIRGMNGNSGSLDHTSLLFQNQRPSGLATGNFENDADGQNDHFSTDMLCTGITQFKVSVVTYIAGYVVKMVRRSLDCDQCRGALVQPEVEIDTNPSFALLKRKKWGSLS